jgi:hypothetical protein
MYLRWQRLLRITEDNERYNVISETPVCANLEGKACWEDLKKVVKSAVKV